ncbi:hypothetical protein [Agromyces laixinhei]|uniref:hypothetical protein n=1 Tax=Agromyces laixinhei TaxID=2585717 RepID=UPI0012EE8634|nr:hypothetical protein [Agromyces laixinhei]
MSKRPEIIFPIAIDPDALLGFRDPAHKPTHLAAGEFIRAHGILSFGPGDERALLDAIGELVGRPQQLWSAAVEYLKKSRRANARRPTSLADFLAVQAMLNDSASLVRLAVVASADDEAARTETCRTNITERTTLPDIDESTAIVESGSIGTFPVGTPRRDIAECFLKPLAARSRLVRVMDPQMLEGYLKNPKSPSAHVEWLLGVLGASLPAGASISLVGTLQGTWPLENRSRDQGLVETFVRDALKSRTDPLTVKVKLVQTMRQPLKNRYLWFDCTDPFDVLHNLAPLGADPLREEFRVERQRPVNFQETKRIAEDYESADQRGMVAISVVFP